MKINKKLLSLLTLFVIFLIVGLFRPILLAQQLKLDVPFVPTPYEVVEDMLRFAELKKGDILYDLGCGDGRIVIEAAKRAGIRAVGIDLDPERIRESRENARAAGVEHLVEFRRGDIFQADFSEATVVTMYLLPEVNIRLRPTILKLKPGTRIISHQFDMDDWQPEKMTYVPVDLYVHTVYLWIVPANISGTWDWQMTLDRKKIDCRMEIEQRFQYFSGKLYLGEKEFIIPETKILGPNFELEIESGNLPETVIRLTGKAVGDRINGTIITTTSGKNAREKWTSVRRQGSIRPIDQ